MYTKKEQEYYNEKRQRACDRLGITKNQYNWFRREGEALRKLYTDYCNGTIESQEHYEDTETRQEEKIVLKADKIGLCLYLQTDPRGASVYLDTKPIQDNAYTDAVCIY